MANEVQFYHHNKKNFNIGDYLCTPSHYFNFKYFEPDLSNKPSALFVGGGTYNKSFGTDNINDYNFPVNIGWGLGITINNKNTQDLKKIRETISKALNIYDICSTRDKEISEMFENLYFVPCVSVMNNIVEVQTGTKTGIFLNDDKKRTSIDTINKFRYQNSRDIVFSTNAVNEIEFRYLFGQTNKIITNSYHVSYWGLLSGRSVAIIGYSSKFESLMKLFNLNKERLLTYKKNNLNLIDQHIELALNNNDYFQNIVDPKKYISEFRKINIKYADTLVERKLFSEFEIIQQDDNSLYKRSMEVHDHYELMNSNFRKVENSDYLSTKKKVKKIYKKIKRKFS